MRIRAYDVTHAFPFCIPVHRASCLSGGVDCAFENFAALPMSH